MRQSREPPGRILLPPPARSPLTPLTMDMEGSAIHAGVVVSELGAGSDDNDRRSIGLKATRAETGRIGAQDQEAVCVRVKVGRRNKLLQVK